MGNQEVVVLLLTNMAHEFQPNYLLGNRYGDLKTLRKLGIWSTWLSRESLWEEEQPSSWSQEFLQELRAQEYFIGLS